MDRRLSSDAGFTLVELMVVVAMLALLSVSAVLSLSRPSAEARDWARFQALHDRLRAEATLSRQRIGLAVSATGVQRLSWDNDWQTASEPQPWHGAVTLQTPPAAEATIVFTPSGQTTPIRLQFKTPNGATQCATEGWGPLTCAGG
ncbi:General secretion pathway protein H [Candidatus Rhodobacter oscarellae]|uniref:Type II secretion system protein H n=1 Tax=Candidatus Rhodobacter oscarellae TaxID=1675527 RepID=A0A0J9H126_9RHOB|nr:GspH/FimT family pseudopilin [Candidatus Rhodobacter lobularis]KMW59443.1 General secretion pathway protein H [Candidatus Rhodobacter lobularis]